MFSQLSTLKDTLFQQVCKEDIEMVSQWREMCMLVKEDRIATQRRFVERVKKFNAHHCPTIKDFKPYIDNLLT